MYTRISIKFFVLVMCLSFTRVSAQGEKFLSELNTILNDTFFTSCNAGIEVYNLSQKKPLFSRDRFKLMNPASNMKVITSIAGLVYLGKDYSFKTKIGYTGKIENSVLNGDVVIVGYGDPDFKMDSLNKCYDLLSAFGIKEIKGDILLDVSYKDSLFWGEGWMWDDDGAVTSPFMSALNIYGNTVKVTVSPVAGGGRPHVSVYPVTSYFEIVNSASMTNEGTDLRVWRDYLERTNKIFVKGKMSYGSPPSVYIFNVWQPEFYFATLLKEKLERGGIKVSGKARIIYGDYKMTQLYEFQHPYSKLINQLNKKSDNLYAEMVLLALGGISRNKNVSFADGKKYQDIIIKWAGKNPADYRLSDGSGVSRYNVVSASLLLALTNKIYETGGELFDIYYNSLPIAGVDGTLASRMKTGLCFNNLHAKTGTLSGVSSLTGYVRGKSGDMISFSIMMQNFPGSAAKARGFQDAICEIIAQNN